jgi:hypothetical protein
VRAVRALADRVRRLADTLATIRAELEAVLNGLLFVPPDRCLLCAEVTPLRRDADGCRGVAVGYQRNLESP